MPRLLNILGFLVFVLGAVSLAVAAYVFLAGVIGWNPFSHGRPMIAGVNTMAVMLGTGVVLLALGAVLGRAAVRAEARTDSAA